MNPLNDPVYFNTDDKYYNPSNEILGSIINTKCDWCGRKHNNHALLKAHHIDIVPIKMNYENFNSGFHMKIEHEDTEDNLVFCNFACAKLYYDNIHKIKVNTDDYRVLYIDHKLIDNARNIYDRVYDKHKLFEYLPIMKINQPLDTIDRVKCSKQYASFI
jgi:hypothetical protein